MPISTANTILSYTDTCPIQVETATVVGTIGTGGNATVVVTSRELVGSPVTLSVAVTASDSATAVAGKIRTALGLNNDIAKLFTIGGTGATVVLTRKIPTSNDTTLNISIANGTCTGLTSAPTSANTTAGGTFTKLVDIVSYPDMGSTPAKLDITTLTETTYKQSMFGLQEHGDMSFEALYDDDVYQAITNLSGTSYFLQLTFGTIDGKFDWQGQIRCYAMGGGVDEVRKMTVVISALTPLYYTITN